MIVIYKPYDRVSAVALYPDIHVSWLYFRGTRYTCTLPGIIRLCKYWWFFFCIYMYETNSTLEGVIYGFELVSRQMTKSHRNCSSRLLLFQSWCTSIYMYVHVARMQFSSAVSYWKVIRRCCSCLKIDFFSSLNWFFI